MKVTSEQHEMCSKWKSNIFYNKKKSMKNYSFTLFSAMYSIPLAISRAKPVSLRGESGMTGCREGG
jgi:hypothetical protein